MSALPTFCVIGAMKSGTTSLHHYLAAHPEISMSRPKELDFFVAEKNYDRGVDWYASHFDDAAAVRGESSTNYTKCHIFDGVPARMNALLPNVKLVYVLRDPIERLISHYEHNRSRGRESRTFDEALRSPERNHYVQCSQYLTQLEAFLEYYTIYHPPPRSKHRRRLLAGCGHARHAGARRGAPALGLMPMRRSGAEGMPNAQQWGHACVNKHRKGQPFP